MLEVLLLFFTVSEIIDEKLKAINQGFFFKDNFLEMRSVLHEIVKMKFEKVLKIKPSV